MRITPMIESIAKAMAKGNLTIWKFELVEHFDVQEVMIPKGAHHLTLQLDPNGKICFWAMLNPNNEKITRKFRIIGTGQPCHDLVDSKGYCMLYVATIVKGPLVLHVFELEQ